VFPKGTEVFKFPICLGSSKSVAKGSTLVFSHFFIQSYEIASRFYTTSACGGIQKKQFPLQSSLVRQSSSGTLGVFPLATLFCIQAVVTAEQGYCFLWKQSAGYRHRTKVFFEKTFVHFLEKYSL
jgi:hypothetical protein